MRSSACATELCDCETAFPLIPAVRNSVLSLLVSRALCATPELVAALVPSCSSVTVSMLPVKQQLIALPMSSNEE